MASKSIAGKGSLLSIGNGATGTEVFTAVAELTNIALSGRQMGTEETTHLQSTAREFLPTIVTSGAWDIQGNRVGTDAGLIAMESSFSGGRVTNFKLLLPIQGAQTTTGDLFAFAAVVEEVNYGPMAVDKKIQVTAKLKVTGVITITPGT